jgi:competence protein ComEC
LISISGLHVALLVGLIFYIGIRVGIVREKLSRTLVMILPVYAILTGATPPVNRAVIMTMMILAVTSLKFPIKLRSIDGLCVSFLFLSIQNPIIIYNIGFQLSYIVTLSLLLSLSIVTKYQSNLSKMMITSYISQASALPFLLYHFYEIPLFSLIANILYIPLYSFIFLPGLILLFLLQFLSNELFQFLTLLLSYLIGISDRLAGILSSILWTRSIPGKPSLLFLILYTISILVSFYGWGKSLRLRASLTLPWIVLSAHLLSPILSPEGEVTVIDVGQGDSIFIKLPYNRGNYLIDTGGNIVFPEAEWKRRKNKYDVGQDVLVPFLKSKGVQSLDLLILTHGDLDHIGGSFSLLNELKVKKIVLPSVLEKSLPEKKLIKLAETKNIAVSYVNEGVGWKMKNSEFFVLSPPPKYLGEKNDGSIVLYAKIGGVNWLFTGDLGKEGEKHLIEKYPKLAFDILKVGHHGSRTSTSAEFIQHFRPKYSIISVGEKNGFGHPHSDVLNNLKAGGSEILRTDIHGGITFYFRGERGTFYKSIP